MVKQGGCQGLEHLLAVRKRDDGGDLVQPREELDQLANAWPRLEVVRVDLHGAPSIEGDVAKEQPSS